VGHVTRDILLRFFRGVEPDNPDRVLVVAFEHVHDDRFEVGALDISFAIGAAVATEIVQYDADGLIVAWRYD
jgi:hypothetical protein